MREIPDHLEVIENELYVGGVGCVELAEKFGTPTYVYNSERIVDNFRRLEGSLRRHADREVAVYYAVKANFNPAILELLAELGAYADILSIDEAKFASSFGFEKGRIMFTGTSVSDDTLRYLLDAGVLINIDSFSQMRRLAAIAPEGLDVSIRWNPGSGAGFNPKVITAGAESHGRPVKFGIEEPRILEAYGEAVDLGLNPVGLHQHIGSGWTGRDVE
ncbi:MAG: diaminopimelate decarboxylase family protein, partial [Candidatus Bathyarchaeia archaeon]